METEQQAYEVPGQQLRWRAAQLQQQGYPFQVQPAGGGIYIVIVQQPPGLDPFAYQPPRQPQVWPRWDSARVLQWLAILGVVAILLGTLYMTFGRSDKITAEVGGMRLDPATGHMAKGNDVLDWFAGLRLPWAGEPAAQGNQVQQPQADAEGFKWPWDSAAESAADALESVQGTVTVVSASILAVLVLLIVLALLRKADKR